MMPSGSEPLLREKARWPTFHLDAIAATRSASAHICIEPATWSSGSSIGSNTVAGFAGSQRATTSWRRTTSLSFSLRRSGYGYGLMSPRPRRLRYFFSAARKDSRRASNIQYSATFSYALLVDGSVACAARCLASSAFRRQASLSDDIRGGSSKAPNQTASRCVGSSGHDQPPSRSWPNPRPSENPYGGSGRLDDPLTRTVGASTDPESVRDASRICRGYLRTDGEPSLTAPSGGC
jgi:hypothetical protein